MSTCAVYKNKMLVGTRVLTNRGFVAVEEVTLQDSLITHSGVWKVQNIQSKQSSSIYLIPLDYFNAERDLFVDENVMVYDTQKFCWTKAKHLGFLATRGQVYSIDTLQSSILAEGTLISLPKQVESIKSCCTVS